MPYIDKLFTGDMAYKHDNGACLVEDAAAEQRDAIGLKSVPLARWWVRMTELTDEAADFENPLIDALGLSDGICGGSNITADAAVTPAAISTQKRRSRPATISTAIFFNWNLNCPAAVMRRRCCVS